METQTHNLSPRRTRVLVLIAMAAVALLAIWLIDRRAMMRMHEMADASGTSDIRHLPSDIVTTP